jgi:hypothetical protein
MPKSPGLTLITGSKDTKPCPVAEIAALDFEPLLSGLSQKQRLRRVRELVDLVSAAAVVASEMVTKTKAELIAMAREKHEECGVSLMEFAHIKGSAHMLASIIQGAELRLAVALANVEKDGHVRRPREA